MNKFFSLIIVLIAANMVACVCGPQSQSDFGYGLVQQGRQYSQMGQPPIGRYGAASAQAQRIATGICPGYDDGGVCIGGLDTVNRRAEYACAFRDGSVPIFSVAAQLIPADADGIGGLDPAPYLCVPVTSGQVYFEDVENNQEVQLIFLRYSKSEDHLVGVARCKYRATSNRDYFGAGVAGHCRNIRT